MASEPIVSTHLASVALINAVSNGKAPKPCYVGSATGFFFEHEQRVFLVTNRHVVIKEKDQFYPDHLIVPIHDNQSDIDSIRELVLPLYDSKGNPLWLEHENKEYDLAAIEIGNSLNDTDVVVSWKFENILPMSALVNVGTPLWVIGYPMRFFDPKHQLPMVRGGMLSTPYGLTFNEMPVCLIDANLHQGY